MEVDANSTSNVSVLPGTFRCLNPAAAGAATTACATALQAACPRTPPRRERTAAGVMLCDACAGKHQQSLRASSCSAADVQSWCAMVPAGVDSATASSANGTSQQPPLPTSLPPPPPPYWPTAGWRITSAESVGMSTSGLAAAAEWVGSLQSPDAFLVVRGGFLVTERYWGATTNSSLHDLESGTKSIGAIALAHAVHAGREWSVFLSCLPNVTQSGTRRL